MKLKLAFILLLILFSSNSFCQWKNNFTPSIEIEDSVTRSSSINFGRVAWQVVGGVAAGTIFSFSFQINPFLGGIGFLAGSTIGVSLVGNIGGYKSNYLFTFLGGAVGSTIFYVGFNQTYSGYALFFYGLLAAIPFEILTYYLFREESKKTIDVSTSNSAFLFSQFSTHRIFSQPDISIELLRVEF